MSSASAVARVPGVSDLDALLVARVRRGAAGPLSERTGALVLDAGVAGRWTITVESGRASVHRGSVAKPAATVRAAASVLVDVVNGTTSGAEAFLTGQLTVRGDLSLALALDGAFETPERPLTQPRMTTAFPLGVRTACLAAGDPTGPAVLLLHGLGATSASMLPLVVGLGRDHHVVAADMPGFGASDAPRWKYTPEEMARWASALCRELGLQDVIVVGNSLGGRVALELALRDPRRIRGLVLLCPSPAFRRLRHLVPAVRLLPPALGAIPFPTAPHEAVVGFIRLLFSRPARLPRSWYDAGADEFRRVMAKPRHRRAFLACLRQVYVEEAFGDRGFWDRIPRISAPALFLWGDRDRLVPAGFARHITEAIPHARSVVLEDCGHVPQFELPEQTEALVRELISEALNPGESAIVGRGRQAPARRASASPAG